MLSIVLGLILGMLLGLTINLNGVKKTLDQCVKETLISNDPMHPLPEKIE
jgi:hypothetical protein